MSQIRKIVVHCSDTPASTDIGRAEIKKWHIERGWSDIGYHRVIRRNGSSEVGRFENGDSFLSGPEIGAHVKGHNSDSLAVCLVGRGKYEPEQICTLLRLLHKWQKDHDLKPSDVYGHYEFDAGKTCPMLDMKAVRRVLEAMQADDTVG